MSPFRDVRVSRRVRWCDECAHHISRKERYVRLALPPGRDPNYGEHFWILALHEGCAR